MAWIQERVNKDGKITSWRVFWRHDGAKKAQSFKAKRDAEAWRDILDQVDGDAKKAQRALLAKNSDKPPVREVVLTHIGRLIKPRPYTLKRYRQYQRDHLGGLGSIPIDQVIEDDMIAWIKEMQHKGLSPKTIKNVHGLISATMDTAVRLDMRPDNPCNSKLLPDNNFTEDKTTFLTMEEFRQVAGHLDAWPRVMFEFLIATGLRLGEATALSADDFDFSGQFPSVRITKSWQEVDNGWTIGPPKTRKARRTVSLAPSTALLVQERMRHIEPGEKLFTTRIDAEKQSNHYQWNRIWVRARNAARKDEHPLRKIPRIHDLRHSHASLMIAQGMNLFELANRLGHESITTTANTYGHLQPGAHFRGATMIEQAMSMEGASIAGVAFGRKEIG